MLHYMISEFNSCDQFLALVARKIGKLKKGARPDINAAAKRILHDWNSGKLRYFTHPPEATKSSEQFNVPAEVVAEFSKEFDIDSLLEDQNEIVESLPMEAVDDGDDDEDDDEEEEDEDMDTTVKESKYEVTSGKKKKAVESDEEMEETPKSLKIDGNVQLNKFIKKTVKNSKKKQRKMDKRTEKLTGSMDFSLSNMEE